ncbi:MAG: response regulator, partial [Verrucomicrobiota bacterium]
GYELEFAVRDSGIGIPADRIGKLFHRFSQVDASTARQHGGTGLGLAISHRLAALHGGRMWVESESGRGSCFRFTLTARTASAAPAPTASADGIELLDATFAARHPARILIAEDNPVNQKVLDRMLQKLGYTTEIAGNGREALAALHARPFDLVFMDVEMPELDGPAATRLIRAELPPARQPVVVAVTAHALSGSRESLLAAGMDAYISKPLRLADLTSTLARLPELRKK